MSDRKKFYAALGIALRLLFMAPCQAVIGSNPGAMRYRPPSNQEQFSVKAIHCMNTDIRLSVIDPEFQSHPVNLYLLSAGSDPETVTCRIRQVPTFHTPTIIF